MPLPDAPVWELTFARGAVDQAAVGVFEQQSVPGVGDYAISSSPLPDIVMVPGSYVTIQRFTQAGADVVLQQIATTYTPGVGPASVSQGFELTPFLLPQANG